MSHTIRSNGASTRYPPVIWAGAWCDACACGKHEACSGGWDFCGCAHPECLVYDQEDT